MQEKCMVHYSKYISNTLSLAVGHCDLSTSTFFAQYYTFYLCLSFRNIIFLLSHHRLWYMHKCYLVWTQYQLCMHRIRTSKNWS